MSKYEWVLDNLRHLVRDKRHSEVVRHYLEQAVETIEELAEGRVNKGYWILWEEKEHNICRCSWCGQEFYYHKKGQYQIDKSRYCPACGTRMEAVQIGM